MLVKAAFSFYGLVANINGWRGSRTFRILGALLGAWIWTWFLSKFVLVDFPYPLGAFFAAIALVFCIRTVALAYLNLPRPGVPGAL
jgi:hypothetical protein